VAAVARLRVGRQVQHVHLVGDQPVVGERHHAPRALLAHDVHVGPVARQLFEENLPRPGRAKREPLDLHDRVQIGRPHRFDREGLGRFVEGHGK